VRRFIQIVLLLLLLGAGGTAWYLYNKGFTKPWREWVVEELRKRGAEVSFSKLTVEPFRGLVAKDVKVFDSAARKRVIAKVDEMVIEANYAHAARGKPFLDALTLVDASLLLPLEPRNPKGPAVKIEKLNTRIHLPPKQLLVARLDAEVFGIRVSASGQLANPEMARPGDSKDPSVVLPPVLVRVVRELQALEFEGPAPRLDFRFSGDLSKPESLVVEAELDGEKIRSGNYLVESLALAANWRNRALVIPRFEARDRVGQLQLSASYQSATGVVEARLRSGMDLPGLLRATGVQDLGEISFSSVPQLDVTASVTLPAGERPLAVKATGQVRVGPFSYGPVPMDRLSADFSWDGRRWAVRELVVRHASGGELRADAQQDVTADGKGDFRLGLSSTLNPEVLGPYFRSRRTEEGRLAAMRLALFKFYDAPRITLSARGPSPMDCAASGELTLGRTGYRNSEASRGHANLRFNGRVLNVDDFVVHRTEGIGGGAVAFDLQDKLVHIKNVRTALVPADVAIWIDPDLLRDIEPYRFGKKPPMLLVNGVVDQRRPHLRTRLDVKLDAPAMDYTFCGKDLQFTNVDARLAFTDERLKLTDVRAELFGGTVKGEADISIVKAKPGHTATLRFGGVDFQRLTKLYFDYDESQGKLDATYSFAGAGDNGRAMRGEGEMAVTDGNVFAIPFLGPFSDILNKIVPGMGYNKAQKAAAKFTVANGIITTKDFVVTGKGFSMIGDGRIWFLDDRMDFDMRINAQGLPGVLLFPVSKLLEYRTQSKFSEPAWRPKVIPKLGTER
jgi:AsmA-like C-terminal region